MPASRMAPGISRTVSQKMKRSCPAVSVMRRSSGLRGRTEIRFSCCASQFTMFMNMSRLPAVPTTELAASYTRFLDTLNGLRRVEEIRRFRALDYDAKKRHILALMDSAPPRPLLPPPSLPSE